MLTWIFAGIIVYAGIVLIPSFFLLGQIGFMGYAKGRDNETVGGPLHGRALRALRNTKENFPVFLTLAVSAMIVEGANSNQAELGAQMFVISRLFYAPAYMSGVPFLRSSFYTVGLIGMVVMAVALMP
jgi:uncharacterized MAPEG superfamily protein